jgi:hypothetical protein
LLRRVYHRVNARWYPPFVSASWTIVFEDEVDGKPLVPGTVFKLFGEKGKSYTYTRTVTNERGSVWVDCYGGGTRVGSRSIRRESIKPDSIIQREVPPESPKETPPKTLIPKEPTPKSLAAKKRCSGSKPLPHAE